MTYKVLIHQWVYVNANSEDEAMDKAIDGDFMYSEEDIVEATVVDEL